MTSNSPVYAENSHLWASLAVTVSCGSVCFFLLFRNKYLLLNSQELNELSAISMKANIPEVEALVNTDRSLVCDGKKGLLTRILTVMKREPPDSSFRSALPR